MTPDHTSRSGEAGLDPAAPPPPLHEPVCLYMGNRSKAGAPTYALPGPATDAHVQLGARELEMLTRWQLADPTAIAGAAGRQSVHTAAPEEVEAMKAFLEQNGLLRLDGRVTPALWQFKSADRSGSRQRQLTDHVLFRWFPLLTPACILAALATRAAFVFSPAFWLVLALLAAFGLALVSGTSISSAPRAPP